MLNNPKKNIISKKTFKRMHLTIGKFVNETFAPRQIDISFGHIRLLRRLFLCRGRCFPVELGLFQSQKTSQRTTPIHSAAPRFGRPAPTAWVIGWPSAIFSSCAPSPGSSSQIFFFVIRLTMQQTGCPLYVGPQLASHTSTQEFEIHLYFSRNHNPALFSSFRHLILSPEKQG